MDKMLKAGKKMKLLSVLLLSVALLGGCSSGTGLSTGDLVSLKHNSPSGNTKEYYDKAVENIENKEETKLGVMMANGQMAPLDKGSIVEVVAIDGSMIKVRLSDDSEWWLRADSVE